MKYTIIAVAYLALCAYIVHTTGTTAGLADIGNTAILGAIAATAFNVGGKP
jgi:hypothetical protein